MKIVDGKPEYKGTIDVLGKVVKQEGVFALWRGFTPYYTRLGPHTVLTFIFLEQLNSLYYRYVLGQEAPVSMWNIRNGLFVTGSSLSQFELLGLPRLKGQKKYFLLFIAYKPYMSLVKKMWEYVSKESWIFIRTCWYISWNLMNNCSIILFLIKIFFIYLYRTGVMGKEWIFCCNNFNSQIWLFLGSSHNPEHKKKKF